METEEVLTMADKLSRSDLLSLEDYHEQRADMRRRVMTHKALRKVFIGDHVGLYFEDRLTIQYQIQEMLRIERIFAGEAIQEELDAYNPLIPDGDNLKATMMIEFEDVAERRVMLEKLRGIEDRVYLKADDGKPVFAIADEDLDRANDDKTSAVHFLRFQPDADTIAALKNGAALSFGTDHDAYRMALTLPGEQASALVADLA